VPSRNTLKQYESGGYYHIYNRGVEKRDVFLEVQDYKVFLSYLRSYLLQPSEQPKDLQGQFLKVVKVAPSRKPNNFQGEISLIAYCLMPNHFHLLVRQNTDHGIEYFMRSLATKYVRYFNTHYKRVGHLFQGRYKAVAIDSEYQFTYLTKYIHRNPLSLPIFKDSPCRLSEYPYSSYGVYLGNYRQAWVKPEDVLAYFSRVHMRNSYQSFVEETFGDDLFVLRESALDMNDD
jgi:putative transposase